MNAAKRISRGTLRSAILVGCSLSAFAGANAQDKVEASSGTVQPGVQSSSSNSADGHEITVIARNRVERLQDVPLVVNVISSNDIHDKGIKSVFDLSKIAPSFTYIATVRGQATITMRGLSPNSLVPEKQGVGFFLDGVYLPGEATSFNLQDLDHVEVLKGPQATQFGRSTYAGAVNYVTRTPTLDHASGQVTGEVSSFDSYEVNGLLNTPVIDDGLYASLSARRSHRGGRYRENNYDTEEGVQNSTNVAASLLAMPWTGARIRIRGSYDRDNDGHQVSYTLYRQDMAKYNQTFPNGVTYPVFTIDEHDTSKLGASHVLDPDKDGGRTRSRYFVYLIADQDLGSGYTVNYTGEYFNEYNRWPADVTNRWLADPALTDPVQVINPTQNRTETNSHQIRITSPSGGSFQWLAGLFYLHETYITYSKDGKVTLNPFSIVGGYPGERDAPLVTENKAAFFSLNYSPLRGLSFTFEGRYQKETLSVDGCDLSKCQRYGASYSRSAGDFLPRATISYKFFHNIMGYALYSEGVKSGVINLSSSAATSAAALAYESANYQSPERNKNYEIGLKGSVLDRRLSFEAAVYHMDVTNQQVSTFGVGANGATTSYTGNGGRSRINGAELSLTARITPRWDANFGVGYAHQEFVGGAATNSTLISLFGTSSPKATLDGLTSTQTPRWTMNGGTEFRVPVTDQDMVAVRGDWTYVGRRYVDVPNLIQLPARSQFNLSTRYQHKKTELTLFVNNVLNDRKADDASIGYGNVVEQGTRNSGATPSVIVNLPYGRVLGLRVTQAF